MINVNKAGADWGNTKAWLAARIDGLHRQMEDQLSAEEYHQCRGAILLARELIEQVEPTTPPQIEEENYGISNPDGEV